MLCNNTLQSRRHENTPDDRRQVADGGWRQNPAFRHTNARYAPRRSSAAVRDASGDGCARRPRTGSRATEIREPGFTGTAVRTAESDSRPGSNRAAGDFRSDRRSRFRRLERIQSSAVNRIRGRTRVETAIAVGTTTRSVTLLRARAPRPRQHRQQPATAPRPRRGPRGSRRRCASLPVRSRRSSARTGSADRSPR